MRKWLINLRGDISQKELSESCGISQSFYSWIETGERTPSVETAKKIANALDFNWTKFFEDETELATNE